MQSSTSSTRTKGHSEILPTKYSTLLGLCNHCNRKFYSRSIYKKSTKEIVRYPTDGVNYRDIIYILIVSYDHLFRTLSESYKHKTVEQGYRPEPVYKHFKGMLRRYALPTEEFQRNVS